MTSRWIVALTLGLSGFSAQAAPSRQADMLTPRIAVGAHFANVFSIASSIKAEGFDERVGRNSGSADYTVTQISSGPALIFRHDVQYDGEPRDQGVNIFRDGGATACWNGPCQTYTDASGLVYNRLLWGEPPAKLKAGMVWRVTIRQPWELGPAGVQTVTVVRVDAADGTVTLKREGSATGAFAGEPATTTLIRNGVPVVMDVAPGRAHWSGYTTFRRGIVLSDELLVVRIDVLRSKDTGPVQATRRRYMLLNAAPFPTLYALARYPSGEHRGAGVRTLMA